MSDLIDRQEAISVVSFAMADSPSITREDWNAIIEAVQCIPSASTELSNDSPKLDNKNGELISRKDAIDAINVGLQNMESDRMQYTSEPSSKGKTRFYKKP